MLSTLLGSEKSEDQSEIVQDGLRRDASVQGLVSS